MSYQRERGEAIARLTEYGLPYGVIETLLRCATSINRYAELACSSEAADRDRVKCPASTRPGHPCLCDGEGHDGSDRAIPRITLQDYRAEQRAITAIEAVNSRLCADKGWIVAEHRADLWRVITSGDPRGYTLRVVPPQYAEENKTRNEHDPRAIGIPPGPSRLRF